MTISLRAARSLIVGDVSLVGPVTVFASSTNTYTITDYNSFSTYDLASNVGTVSRTNETITLKIPNPIGAAQVNLTVTRDGKPSLFVIAGGASLVTQPTITSPTAGQTGVGLTPTIQSSAFATVPAGQGVHQSSQWQIATTSDFLNIAYDSGIDTVNKTSVTVPNGLLTINTPYYVRVKHTSSTIGASAWSPTVTFTTTNSYIVTPTVTITGGTTNVGQTPTITTSAFTVFGGTDTHTSTDWIITKVSDGSTVWQSVGNTTNKTSIVVPANVLIVGTQYTAKARFTGAVKGSSAYGTVNFTTATSFIPTTPGTPFGGGLYAGKITEDDGKTYAIIVAPKAQGGEASGTLAWKTTQTTTTGTDSLNNGFNNTAAMVAAGIFLHPAAQFCKGLSINGYTDWYLPAKDELNLIYTNRGSLDAFVQDYYWSSTQNSSSSSWYQSFNNGGQSADGKTFTYYVRGVRRVAV